MGRCKQLLPLPDRPAVVRCVESLFAAGIENVVVVVGPQGEAVAKTVVDFPVTVVRNDIPGSDMATSVRMGLAAIDETAAGVFVCLCDHPLVQAATLSALRSHWLATREAIAIPLFAGRKGHPTLFPRSLLAEIYRLPTLREVIGKHGAKVSLFEVADAGTVLDMDTWEDYQEILNRCGTTLPIDGRRPCKC